MCARRCSLGLRALKVTYLVLLHVWLWQWPVCWQALAAVNGTSTLLAWCSSTCTLWTCSCNSKGRKVRQTLRQWAELRDTQAVNATVAAG